MVVRKGELIVRCSAGLSFFYTNITKIFLMSIEKIKKLDLN